MRHPAMRTYVGVPARRSEEGGKYDISRYNKAFKIAWRDCLWNCTQEPEMNKPASPNKAVIYTTYCLKAHHRLAGRSLLLSLPCIPPVTHKIWVRT